MNFLCERVGFFLKQYSSATDIKIHYLVVDGDFGLFYSRNLAYLERFIRECDPIPYNFQIEIALNWLLLSILIFAIFDDNVPLLYDFSKELLRALEEKFEEF